MIAQFASAVNGCVSQPAGIVEGGESVAVSLAQRLANKQPVIPDAVYDRNEAAVVTGFSLSTLMRAEERGDLLGRYEGRRRFYLGKDLLDWLAGAGRKE